MSAEVESPETRANDVGPADRRVRSMMTRPPRFLLAAFTGGGLGGVVNMAAAMVLFRWANDASPMRVLLAVASGVFGEDAMAGGWLLAAIGFGLHMVIAVGAGGVYVAVMRVAPGLFRNLHVSCLAFSVGVYVVMNHVVVPVSRTVFVPPTDPLMISLRFVIQLVTIGYPIALAADRLVLKRLQPVGIDAG